MYEYAANVLKVIDGDTVDLSVDVGFHIHVSIRTRLLGIDAPEVSTQAGKDARNWLRDKLLPGRIVKVQTEKDPGDKYGRWLARITDTALGDVAEAMIAEGHAKRYSL